MLLRDLDLDLELGQRGLSLVPLPLSLQDLGRERGDLLLVGGAVRGWDGVVKKVSGGGVGRGGGI